MATDLEEISFIGFAVILGYGLCTQRHPHYKMVKLNTTQKCRLLTQTRKFIDVNRQPEAVWLNWNTLGKFLR